MARAKVTIDKDWGPVNGRATKIPWGPNVWDLLEGYRACIRDMTSGRRNVTSVLASAAELSTHTARILEWKGGKDA